MNRASPGPPGEGATGACDDDLERDLVRLNDSLIKSSNIRVKCYTINPQKHQDYTVSSVDNSLTKVSKSISKSGFSALNLAMTFNEIVLILFLHVSIPFVEGSPTFPSKPPLEFDMSPTNDPSWYN